MEKFIFRKKEIISSSLGTKPKKKNSKFSILKGVSPKKFGTGINHFQNKYYNINSLLNKLRSVFHRKTSTKKESNLTNTSSNSNIQIKSVDENIISNFYNNNKILLSSNGNEKSFNSLNSKLEGSFIKNPVKFFHKFFEKENELNKKKHVFNTKIEQSKLIKDIEKENNKIRSKISKQKRKSAAISPGFNKKNYVNSLFKFGKNKKKKSKNLDSSFKKLNKNNTLKKRRMSIFSKREGLIIKSFQKINSEISKKIRRQSVRNIKNEIKQLETLDINKLIEKSPKRRETQTQSSSLKSLELTNISYDIMKFNKIKEFEYQRKFRQLFLCNNLYDSLDDEENEDLDKINSFYIGPTDISCYIIDLLSLIACIISFIYIPYFLVFDVYNRKN